MRATPSISPPRGAVALSRSGDAGIYGMATPGLRAARARRRSPPGERIPRSRDHVPGISAMQAAAAARRRTARPRFLRDLALRPPDALAGRSSAGSQRRPTGDFVVALYNPASERRRDQLPRAIEILREQRPPETPVVIARNLGRAGEAVAIANLATFDTDAVDMLTLVSSAAVDARSSRAAPAAPGLHAARLCGEACRYDARCTGQASHDGAFHRRRAGRARPDHGARPRLIARCPVVLYAGSLVPPEVVAAAPPDARVIDTAPLHLDEIIAEIAGAHAGGQEVARVHSGDPSLYGAIAEQMRRLRRARHPLRCDPGVPAFAAAAAALGPELTLPEVSQTVILTRTAVPRLAMPEGEELAAFGATGATLAIHLSIRNLAESCAS